MKMVELQTVRGVTRGKLDELLNRAANSIYINHSCAERMVIKAAIQFVRQQDADDAIASCRGAAIESWRDVLVEAVNYNTLDSHQQFLWDILHPWRTPDMIQ